MKRSLHNSVGARLVAVAGLLMSTGAQAHKFWLLPSETVLADKGWITVDAAISNDLFYFNHHPIPLDTLQVIGPDGGTVKPQNVATGKYRSTFDLELALPGTYRLALRGNTLTAAWKVGNEIRHWRGAAETLARDVPAAAPERKVIENQSRLETFVTVGKPDRKSMVMSGMGLELVPVTHPNDLYANEVARFRFVLDGKPAVGIEVAVVPGGSRYRDSQEEMELKTDQRGEIEVRWPQAGMYWLEAWTEDGHTSIPQATARSASYTATFEVLNQ